jgi:glutaminyl-peptide cyclotransferase
MLVILLSSCRKDVVVSPPVLLDPSAVSGERAMVEVRGLVELGPRDSGTEGVERAAAYIAGKLDDAGLIAEIDEFVSETPNGSTTFHNITTTIDGESDAMVILLSHYDTKSGISDKFVGANDSGSSTGLLIEMMRALKSSKSCPLTVMGAFVDGEECMVEYGANDGLYGSRRLASKLSESGLASKVKAVIVLDMMGDRDLTITVPRNSSRELVKQAFKAAADEGIREKFILGKGGITDDHVPFLKKGMKAIDLIDFQYGSAPGLNDYWHTEQDTVDKLSADSLQAVGRVAIRMINMLAEE